VRVFSETVTKLLFVALEPSRSSSAAILCDVHARAVYPNAKRRHSIGRIGHADEDSLAPVFDLRPLALVA
jgi:hypothetical protein